MTNIDPWFLHQLKEIADVQANLASEPIDAERLREIKRMASPMLVWARLCI